ncbi:SRPBCC family protein [Litorimonas sp. RW-G-Af-16]|uniref:SRPBCC family protein n=1 Tax=Litorimonas sp. RW-G-Af-16 TaxID=3241168 RepID=UPI00390C8FA6
MKWLFRIIGIILLAFIGLCIVGYFLPAKQSIERSVQIKAYPEEIFPYLNDLTRYPQWSVLHAAIGDADIAYGGAHEGVGQSMAWQGSSSAFAYGSQEIVQSQAGEFVLLNINLAGLDAVATHAIQSHEGEEYVTVLTKSEIDLGGFPYLGRIAGKMNLKSREAQYDRALENLKTTVELGVQ